MKYGILTCVLVATSASSAFALGPARDAIHNVGTKVNNTHLTHTWEREGCTDSHTIGASHRTNYEFGAKEIAKVEQYFASPECNDLVAEIRYTGNYKVKKEVQKDINELNMNFTKVTVTALNDAGAHLLSSTTFCGNSRWEVNQPVDLTSYVHAAQCPLKSLPERVYDIYSIEKPRLFFGKDSDKASEYSRPIEIDRELPFLQQ